MLRSLVARSGDSAVAPFALRTETGSLATPTVTQERRSYVTATRAATTALAVLLASGVAACSSSPEKSAAPSTPTSSGAAASSAATSSINPSDEAAAQAVGFVPTYLRVIDDLYLDASRSLDGVYQVAVASEATSEATAIGTFRSQGYRQVGRSQLVRTSVTSMDLTSDPAASPSPKLPTVVVTACVDVSQVQATDASGASVVPADRPSHLIEQLSIVNIDYPNAASWRVSAAPNAQAESCDG